MERRSFIQLSAFAAAAISLPLLHSCKTNGADEVMAHPQFLSRLFDEEAVRDVGRSYLEKVPGEKDETKLIELLTGKDPIGQSTDDKAIHQWLDQKIRADFEAGRTVLVKGWVLAITEARQCALFSLV